MKRLFFLASFIIFCLTICGQQTKLPNTLLWRISGNGLTKPSYLYGTMHVTDKRVFQLGDSVFKALEQTEGFAAELDMNRLGTQMMKMFIAEQEEKAAHEPTKVKDAVSAEVWEKYKVQLEKKFNKKADKITVDDLEDIETKLQIEMFRKGDMPTFLDAWMSGQARSLGKWVGGIEDLEDQLEHIDGIEGKIQLALFDDNYYRGSMDWFIRVYTEQRLDTIDAFMYREENGKKDYIMIKRNVKMAWRMDSLSAIRSTLFAVGAAHLPGDSGVISLLRSKGFTVTPVFSSKKIDSGKYIVKAKETPWPGIPVKDSAYNLQMPGTAESIELFESMGLDMKVFFDLSYMKMYMTLGIELPEERKKLGADTLYKKFKERYTSQGEVLNDKKIMVNGVEGREVTITYGEGEMRMQLFIPNLERMVMNVVYAFTQKSLNDKEAERFFQSFVYNNKPKSIKTPKSWTRQSFPQQAFSIEMPLKPRETKDVNSEEGRIVYGWQAIDIQEQVFYGVSVYATKKGMYNTGDDTTYFLNVKDGMLERMEDTKVLDSGFADLDSYPGFKTTFTGRSEGEIVETKTYSVLRGGFIYFLFAVYTPVSANRQTAERFLNSFKLLPYNHPEWKNYTSPNKSFSTTAPFAPEKNEDEIEDDIHPGSERFIIYDSLASVTVFVDRVSVPSWFWYSSDTAFLRSRALQYTSWDDSIAGYNVEEAGTMKVVSFTVTKPGDHLIKKVKMFLNGNELYEVFGHFAKQDMPGKYNRVFDDFKVLNEQKATDRSGAGADKLAIVLNNADKKTANEVASWWALTEFTKNDIPALQKMLLKIHPDFDTTYYANLNKKIWDRIEFLDSNHTTIQYIKTNYGAIQQKDEYVKPMVISYLTGIQTKEAFEVLKECLVKYSFNISKVPYYSHSFYDSLKLTAVLYPELLKMADNEGLWSIICGTATSLLDSVLLGESAIKAHAARFVSTAKRELGKDKQEIEDGAYSYTDLIRILGIINSPESNGLLNRFSKFANKELKIRTLIAMLKNNVPVDSRTTYTLATTDEYRHELYDELKKINKLKLFPLEFLTQKHLGKSKLYAYATDEEAPYQIENAGERTLLYKGKQQKFYMYKVSYWGDKPEKYLGVAGPYALNLKDVTSSHAVTGIYWDYEFDVKKLDDHLKEYFDSLEEYEEEKD